MNAVSPERPVALEPEGGTQTTPRRRVSRRQFVLALVGVAAAIAAGLFGHYYWTTGRFLESTDDAYVQADFTIVAPKVSGYISEVRVEDNQPVRAGQVVARIDDRDFRTALAQAGADVESAKAEVRNIQAQLDEQQSVIAEAEAAILSDRAGVRFAEEDYHRYHALTATQATSLQDEQRAQSVLQEQQADLERDLARLAAARQHIDVLTTDRAKAKTQVDRLLAVERQATLNLSYTTVIAPIEGTVGARSLRVGQYVQAGTQLMAVVPLQSVYVVGNFKETQLAHVKAGQPVEITVDGLPGVVVKGQVNSLAPASGLEFALLPPDNATGNFTKIVQRIPVKIDLDPSDPLAGRLRPGMSVEPTIDTRGQQS